MTQTFEQLIDDLNTAMIAGYVAVNKNANPIAVRAPLLTAEQLGCALGQYSIFPKNIVYFLGSARSIARNEGWTDVANELTRNISQELGSGNNNEAHYAMLVRGAKDALGVDISDVLPGAATCGFVANMGAIMNSKTPAYVAGATYALESSAVPELRIVMDLTDKLSERLTGSHLKDGDLKRFFAMHLGEWEPSHEDNLRKTLANHIGPSDYASFKTGFHDVMKTMDVWWNGLDAEIKHI